MAEIKRIHQPGQYVLKELTLTSNGSGKERDLQYVFEEINIYEDIFSNTVTGHIIIQEAVGLIEGFPIIGDEELYIKFIPSDNGDFPEYEKTLDIYSISDMVNIGQDTKQYALHFVSDEFTRNKSNRISKSYSGYTSEIVNTILSETLSIDPKYIHIEDTKHTRQVVIPNWNPYKTIKYLAETSISRKHSTGDMLFYENRDGFNFKSVSHMMSQPVIERLLIEPDNVDPTSLNNSRVRNYNTDRTFDTQERLMNGMYASTLISHDIIKKTYAKTEFNYIESFDSYPHVDDQPYPLVEEFYSTSPKAKIFLTGMNYGGTEHVQEYLQSRNSRMNQINNNINIVSVPGSTNRTVGDRITLDIPSNLVANDGTQKDKFLSGNYLITNIRHVLMKDTYEQTIEVRKDCYKEEVEPL